MEFTIYEQTYSFFTAVFLGFFIGIIYEFTRCLKKEVFTSKAIANIADFSFIPVAFFLYFYVFFRFNGFDIRLYHILGTILGLILYFNTINNIISRVLSVFLKFLGKILKILLYPLRFLCKIVFRILLYIINIFKWIFNICSNFLNSRLNSFKKILKRRKKI